ncbi:MAG: tetratricopeptide repeat protein [Anaerolineae bacterium]|nr:tetratricopeptide repeat protein [Gloeobacterales cyanobacterium ES-bin-313]
MNMNAVGDWRNMRLPVALHWIALLCAAALSLDPLSPYPVRAQTLSAEALGREIVEAQQLDEQGLKLREMGQYEKAQPLAKQALAIKEKALGSEHPEVAKSLNNLAVLYWLQGNFAEAEPLHKRALAIREKALGSEHPDVAKSLNNLATLYSERGNYAEAEPLYRRALAIREKALGPEHPDLAKSVNNLANLYADRGEYTEAELLYRRALAIWEKALGSEHLDVAKSLNNLATLYSERGSYAEAEPLYKRALAIREKALGSEHPDVAKSLHNLADLYRQRGEYAEAEPLYRRTLAIKEKTLGPQHPYLAVSLNNLATLYSERGEYAEAESLNRRALAILERALGPQHPYVATTLYNLALLRLKQNRLDDARQTLQQALDIQEYNLALNLPAASQRRNHAYLASLKNAADLALWLHLQRLHNDPQAARLALSASLSRKGRVLDEATLALARLRRRLPPARQEPLQKLAEARTQLATLVFTDSDTLPPDQNQEQVRALRIRVRQLEDSLADAGAGLRALTHPLTLQDVQQALPKDAVLLEYVLYRPFEGKSFGAPRYAAYLLSPAGLPIGVDLGEAKQIDVLIRVWRAWLLDPASPNDDRGRKLARQLYQKLLVPLEIDLKSKQLFIAPDGQLNTLPFAALIDANGRYLLQKHTLTYFVSGRELPRLAQSSLPPQSSPLVIGGPDFARSAAGPTPADRPTAMMRTVGGSIEADKTNTVKNLHSPTLADFIARPLPGAMQESRAVAQLLGIPSTQLLIGALATENALKAARSPILLHLATHAFFLEDQKAGAGLQEPLLRSGVALAGFNARSSGTEDGVLTALEAQGLDLEGTELAVLSACLSGAGPVLGGEGVQGLRRALVLAGTRSQVMALWTVEDQTTVTLMKRFYRGLIAGLGRSEALRQAQLAVSLQLGRTHPYWWASFTASGNWRPVQFSKVPPSR